MANNSNTTRRRLCYTIATSTTSLLFVIAIFSTARSHCSAFAPPPPLTPTLLSSPLSPTTTLLVSGQQRQNKRIGISLERKQPRVATSTSLRMGIRSFIQKKILRRGNKDDGQDSTANAIGDGENSNDGAKTFDSDDDDDDEVNLHSLLQSPESAGLMEGSPNKNSKTTTNDNKKKKTNDDEKRTSQQQQQKEDIQQRIRRVKGGGMTEEEKMIFLNTALTRTNKKKPPRGPPIRQKIPWMDDDDGAGGGGASISKSSSSSSISIDPNKNLWDAITKKGSGSSGGGGKDGPKEDISVASLLMDGKLKNEQAKRLYIESITNPDRFSSFSAVKTTSADSDVAAAAAAFSSSEDDDVLGNIDDEDKVNKEDDKSTVMEDINVAADVTVETDFAKMKRQIADDREFLKPKKIDDKSEAMKAVESILSMISQNDKNRGETKKNSTKDDALASRLEQAAEEQEKRDAEARLAAEKKREDEKMAREEAQRQREDEFRRKEEARIEAARQKAEDVRRKEEEKVEAEKEKIIARQKAQDDYWAKKLEKERNKKGAARTTDELRKEEVATRDREEKMERDVASNVEMERIREEERLREDPHEGEILKEAADARTRDRERVRDIETLAAARVSRTVPRPSNEDVSASSFIAEQRRKKEEIDRLRKFDAEQLKSMNSPLPSPGKMKRQPSVIGKIGQVSPTMYRAPPVVPATKSPKPPSAGLDLASLTMAKKTNQGDVAPPPPPSPLSSSVGSAPVDLSLASLIMAKNKQDVDSPPKNAGVVKKPAKRVVRQQVPITTSVDYDDDGGDYDDDDDDDDDDLMRSGTPGMSIADALKQQRKSDSGNMGTASSGGGSGKNLSADAKAKQWGIDMSKFS